jgi:hypothetical protein
MFNLGRSLIAFGLLMIIIGAVVLVSARLHLPLGRLPGDLTWKGKSWTVSFPLMTSILLSVVVSLIFWIINHFRR